MADTVVKTPGPSGLFGQNVNNHIVWVSEDVGYYFYWYDAAGRISYKKTTTGPAGFAAATEVIVVIPADGFTTMTIMYDRDYGFDTTGTNIHIFWADSESNPSGRIMTRRLNTADDVLTAQQTVQTVTTIYGQVNCNIGVVKTPNGRIVLTYGVGITATEHDTVYSEDEGVTWLGPLSTKPPYASATFRCDNFMFPWIHWDGPTEDFAMVQWNQEDDSFSVYIYDWSAETYTKTLLSVDAFHGDSYQRSDSACYQQSNGHVFAGALNTTDLAWNLFEISSTGQGNTTVVEHPIIAEHVVALDWDCLQLCFSQAAKTVHAWFTKTSSDTITNQYEKYRVWDTVAGSWSAITNWTVNLGRNYRQVAVAMSVGYQGGWMEAIAWEDTANNFWQSLDSAYAIPAGGGGGGGGGAVADVVEVAGITTIL